ncbi:ribonuclease P [Halonotius terrestris]|uniref:Ribonuclease P protein component 4 n=1 Tax=Halonotius terrestris TaxID=2487750 RepID=A0A8J8PCG5_9EURY|nr:ribonuclease P [Halonotius terrestris]TQQ81014.1 ribonuclease P [Halonotius terrestris]
MGIAAERIDRLFALAKAAAADGEFDRSREYVRLARRIAERNRCGLPRKFKRFTCPRCDVALRPGVNVRVRVRDGRVVMRCDCGATKRYPYAEEAAESD